MAEPPRPVALLNSPRITVPGLYDVAVITPNDLRSIACARGVDSYVRHQGAAYAFRDMAGVEVVLGAGRFEWEPGDLAIAMDLRIGRGSLTHELTAAEVARLPKQLLQIKRIR